jgi:F420H(2)-dependent quinone reductase
MSMHAETSRRGPFLPPRWFIRTAWIVHRAYLRVTGGRRGLWLPTEKQWGTMLLVSTGRRSGKEREAILGYVEDGANLVTLAMNGWGAPEPAWWLNLQAQPEATAVLKDRRIAVRAHVATGAERDRLWGYWRDHWTDVEGYAVRRPGETAVVVLEPVEAATA